LQVLRKTEKEKYSRTQFSSYERRKKKQNERDVRGAKGGERVKGCGALSLLLRVMIYFWFEE
jgi:hypothetical protein